MRESWRCLGALCVAALLAGCSIPERAGAPDEQGLSRGKYLVENVAMCVDCHTPRDERGGFDRRHWLKGADLDFQPKHPIPNWAAKAPALAGLPRMGDAAVIKLLETGLMPDGKAARPPMPQYRLSHADAIAVADYLKSLQ
jgi:mono/diheme cytochrome c family protein